MSFCHYSLFLEIFLGAFGVFQLGFIFRWIYLNWSEIFLDCNFNTNKKKYYIHIRQATNLGNTLDRDIDLKLYNKETYTGIKYYFEYSKEKNKLLLAKGFPKNPKIFDNKKTGICSQFRP